jgi:hypothetical protein
MYADGRAARGIEAILFDIVEYGFIEIHDGFSHYVPPDKIDLR